MRKRQTEILGSCIISEGKQQGYQHWRFPRRNSQAKRTCENERKHFPAGREILPYAGVLLPRISLRNTARFPANKDGYHSVLSLAHSKRKLTTI